MAHRFLSLDIALNAAEISLPCLVSPSPQYRDLADQYRRAVVSVGLNLAESRGRTSREEARHLRIAYGSCREAIAALRLLSALCLLRRPLANRVLDQLDHVAAITWKLLHRV